MIDPVKRKKAARSLIQQVHSCIVGEPECGHMQASAVICEIANWLASHTDDDAAAYWAERLYQEAGNETLKEQALNGLEKVESFTLGQLSGVSVFDEYKTHIDNIRRALEALPK
jgi:hypothetical protein